MNELAVLTKAKFGIIHLSDIHFSGSNCIPFENWEMSFKAVKEDFIECSNIYIVISGDIANCGKAEEYDIAYTYLVGFLERLRQRYVDVEIKCILVPGNHDCNFDIDSQLRKNAIDNASYGTIGNDGSVLGACIAVQDDLYD